MSAPSTQELQALLRRHVLDVWFPRSLDHEHGGFRCDFDRKWRSCGTHEKLLEFQARQTLFAAEAALADPCDAAVAAAARHGFACLAGTMWDATEGGWFHRCDRAGRVLENHTKHVHGMAYAIAACVAVHRLTCEAAPLRLAQQAFEWLENTAFDREHGGYLQFFTRDGRCIDSASESLWRDRLDPIGTPVGLKDSNTHSDLLEALTSLHSVWPDVTVRTRLVELVTLFEQRLLAHDGALHFFCLRDWTPVPHRVRVGTTLQTAWRLSAARAQAALPFPADDASRRILRYLREHARDRAGGYFLAGEVRPAAAQSAAACAYAWVEHAVAAGGKVWWVQFEALRTIMDQHRQRPRAELHEEYVALWSYIVRAFVDARHGGIYSHGLDLLPWWWPARAPSLPRGQSSKGTAWKDASHEGRALLELIRITTRSGASPPTPAGPGHVTSLAHRNA
ncbi:MAG TPA: AGE family epimerase/isomerase [Candidatus Limnocylindrales bacterium]|nr:AGE family epimerase/isomerase [Candidatus Limnocylindrales bacterium]